MPDTVASTTIPPETPPVESAARRSLVISVLVLTLTRMVVSMSRRFPYPFIPTIAGQLHVPVTQVQNVMAAQGGVGLSSPIFGMLSEMYGRKRVIMGALALMSAACTLIALVPSFWIFAVTMLLLGLCKFIFDPAMQAYLGDRVPYQRRGLAMGASELSWALSLLISAPIAGLLLATTQPPETATTFTRLLGYQPIPGFLSEPGGLQLIFMLLAMLGVASLVAVWLLIPADYPGKEAAKRRVTPVETVRIIRRSPAALAAVWYAFCLSASNEIFFINYGVWMERSFDLMLAAIGVATTVIALAEIGGEFNVILFADRFGKRRLALAGSLIAAISYVLVPLLATNITGALIGLFILFISVETGIVAAFPLYTEILPNARAVLLSGTAAAGASGRLVGALIGGALLSLDASFILIGAVAMVIGLSATFVLLRFVQEY